MVTVRTPAGDLPLAIHDTALGHAVAKEILEGRTYPRVPFLREVRTVVDVGANAGVAALFFAVSYPGARVLAYEPCPATFELLRRNAAACPRICAFDYGLWDRDGTAPLFLSRVDPVTNSLGASAYNTGDSVPVRLREARSEMAAQGVRDIDVLKVDTEGCELPVLRSLGDLLPGVRALYVEYHAEEDRLALDDLLRGTHVLYHARVPHPHRGDLCYVARACFPSRDALERFRIRGLPGFESRDAGVT